MEVTHQVFINTLMIVEFQILHANNILLKIQLLLIVRLFNNVKLVQEILHRTDNLETALLCNINIIMLMNMVLLVEL